MFLCKPPTGEIGLYLRMRRSLLQESAPVTEGPCPEGLDDFDALMRQHQPRIFRFLLASLRDRDAAENLTQDCFVRAYKAREQFRGSSSLSTWLMHIAANLVRDHEANGRLKFWRRRLSSDVDLNDISDWIPDQQKSPEALALAKEQVEAIWRAAGKLSERQRTVFLLRFVEDMDLLEIAAVTGMKEGTVKTHLFRAVQSLRLGLERGK
jgi:RNA polymerase sigma-70 factor, ECF subfamily